MNSSITIEKDKNPKRKKKWLVRWSMGTDPKTGKAKRPCKGFLRRIDAQAFADEKQREFDLGLRQEHITISLQDFINKYLSIRKVDIKTTTYQDIEDTTNRLLDYFGPYSLLKNIKVEHCEKFISTLKPLKSNHIKNKISLADSTRRKILRNCSKCFKTAVEWGYIPNNPFSGITQKKPRKKPWYYISPIEFKKILEQTKSLRTKCMYSLCYGCGLRYGEMINLTEDNFDFSNNSLTLVNRAGSPVVPPFNLKDYEERTIPLPKWVIEILSQWWLKADNNVPFLFMTSARWEIVKNKWQVMRTHQQEHLWENDYMMNNVLRDFKLCCSKAGIRTTQKLNIHGLRRAYATNLANAGTPAQTLMKLCGHSDISTTMEFYLKSSDANEQRAVEALDEMMRGEVG